MPSELNPCQCGGKAKIRYTEGEFGDEIEVCCEKCGWCYSMKNHYGARPALIKYWNAANPKEGKSNERL